MRRRGTKSRSCSIASFILSLTVLFMMVPQMVLANGVVTTATIVGSLQSEIGCAGDWNPECTESRLVYDAADDVWQNAWTVPAGSWEYKIALNNSWTENYGANATPGGANIPLNLGAAAPVKFYYDHKTHWVTDSRNSVIAVAVGNFQSELGAPGDWDPSNLRAWLQDPDGNGIYTFSTTALPAGNYETKVAINESWDENYGQGGTQNGANIPFTVPANGASMIFTYNAATHVLEVGAAGGTIVVNKLASGGDGTFAFTMAGGGGTPSAFSMTTVNGFGSVTFAGIEPGTYSLTELETAGWLLFSSSSDHGTPASFTLAAGQTVTCNFINQKVTGSGALSMGFWQNKNGQALIKGEASTEGVCNLTPWLRQFAPFQDLSAAASCSKAASYAANVIKAANASGSTMNAMLKAQMLAAALNVYFSDPALGGNKIQSPAPIGGLSVDLTKINKPIGSAAYVDCSGAFGGDGTMTVMEMLTFAASQSNIGGSMWYANKKPVQELAKAAFEAVNCRKTLAPLVSPIGFAILQWPPTLAYTISATDRTDNVYGQAWIDGVTNLPGKAPTLLAQLGMGPVGSIPDGNPDWIWVDAAFNLTVGNNDEFVASLMPTTPGTFDYVYRFSYMGDSKWVYADRDGLVPDGQVPANPGKLTATAG